MEHKLTIERRYGGYTGTRFAAVQCLCGKRVDVRVRGSKDGQSMNAWGDQYPTEETRSSWIKEMALRIAEADTNAS